jgi:hypothetical protein
VSKIFPPLAFSAIVAAMVLALASAGGTGGADAKGTVDIGVEHGASARLMLTMSMGTEPGFLEVSQEGEEALRFSVPQEWQRREVRNASIKDVTADSPAFGFVRWKLPPGAVLSLTVPRMPAGLVVHNPSRTPLSIRLKRVNVETGDVQTDVFLLTQESLRLF